MSSEPTEMSLFVAARDRGGPARLAYAEWLDSQGRALEGDVWRLPETEVSWFQSNEGYISSFYGALIDFEAFKIKWDRPLQRWMKPVQHVFLDAEGNQVEHIPWLALVYYDDGEPAPYLFVECLEDCQGAGWFGEAARYESLGDALTALSAEQRARFGLK